MKLSSVGRTIALATIAVMLFAACSASPGASTGASAAPGGSAAAGGPITVGYLPKDIVNQYFAAAKTGMDMAACETAGSKIIQV